MAGKKVPGCHSGLRPSEKELPELYSSMFHHKNTPGYNNKHLWNAKCLTERRFNCCPCYNKCSGCFNFVWTHVSMELEWGSNKFKHPRFGTNLLCCILSGVNNFSVNGISHGPPQVKFYWIIVWWPVAMAQEHQYHDESNIRIMPLPYSTEITLFTFHRSLIPEASNALRSILLYSKLNALIFMLTSPCFILETSNALSDPTVLTNPKWCSYCIHLGSTYLCFNDNIR
jgi:hypothetical protein